MEHACHSCGAEVEDGVAFCKQCNAPQIRVTAMAPDPPPLPSFTASQQTLADPRAFRWLQALPAAALAGVISSFLVGGLGAYGVGAVGLGFLATGALALFFYRKFRPMVALTPAIGARVGALSGAVGFSVLTLFLAIGMSSPQYRAELHSQLRQRLEQTSASNPDPEAKSSIEFFLTPKGMKMILIFGSVATGVFVIGVCSLGGTLSAMAIRRKDQG